MGSEMAMLFVNMCTDDHLSKILLFIILNILRNRHML